MPINLALALALLFALWLAMRWLAAAPAGAVARGLRLAGLAALVLGGLFLLVTGRIAGLVAMAAGLAPWVARAMRLHGLYRVMKGMWGGRASAGKASGVETRFLRMTLDHDSGRLDGEVLEGPYRGRLLSGLTLEQAIALWRQVATDPQSVQVLEAWLDRSHPDWRGQTGPAAAPGPAGTMTRAEAYEVLGLAAGATPDEIRGAHRRLMRTAHPDAGGSTWIAARLNQARDLLLGD